MLGPRSPIRSAWPVLAALVALVVVLARSRTSGAGNPLPTHTDLRRPVWERPGGMSRATVQTLDVMQALASH